MQMGIVVGGRISNPSRDSQKYSDGGKSFLRPRVAWSKPSLLTNFKASRDTPPLLWHSTYKNVDGVNCPSSQDFSGSVRTTGDDISVINTAIFPPLLCPAREDKTAVTQKCQMRLQFIISRVHDFSTLPSQVRQTRRRSHAQLCKVPSMHLEYRDMRGCVLYPCGQPEKFEGVAKRIPYPLAKSWQ